MKQFKVIQVKRTRGYIENIGFGKEVRRTYKIWGLLLVLLLASTIGFSYISNPIAVASGVIFAGLYILWFWKCYKAGKQLWNDIKDKEEPIIL